MPLYSRRFRPSTLPLSIFSITSAWHWVRILGDQHSSGFRSEILRHDLRIFANSVVARTLFDVYDGHGYPFLSKALLSKHLVRLERLQRMRLGQPLLPNSKCTIRPSSTQLVSSFASGALPAGVLRSSHAAREKPARTPRTY